MTIDEIKKSLLLCSPDGRCQYATNPECPYRVSEQICRRSQLMIDAAETIKSLEEANKEFSGMIQQVRIAVDADCDHCDRW